jgi:hypothetical protein
MTALDMSRPDTSFFAILAFSRNSPGAIGTTTASTTALNYQTLAEFAVKGGCKGLEKLDYE